MKVKMLNGATTTVSVKGGKVMINNALVIKADLQASNGVVHVIDKVLIPPKKGDVERLQGFCVKNGKDQNDGVVKINNINGNTEQAQQNCLNECRKRKDATGCEIIWDQSNRGCYAMTKQITGGSGAKNHYCWVFSRGKIYLLLE